MEKIIILLFLFHISFGTLSLCSGAIALFSAKGKAWHRRFGRLFFYGMTGVFITAIPLALIKSNVFLLLIALFSYYLAFSGWRFAKNKSGQIKTVDKLINSLMLFSSFIMIGFGLYQLYYRLSNHAVVLLVFGLLGFALAHTDYKLYQKGAVTGKQRIVSHLGAMLGAMIATLTAFSVTNLAIKPDIILWLGPTILLVPLIFWWKNKVLTGKF